MHKNRKNSGTGILLPLLLVWAAVSAVPGVQAAEAGKKTPVAESVLSGLPDGFPLQIAEGQDGNAVPDSGRRVLFVPVPYTGADGQLYPLRQAEPAPEFLARFPEFAGRTLDLASGEEAVLRDPGTGRAEFWIIRGGYQLPGSSFREWHEERVTGFLSIGTRKCAEMAGADADSVWDNGNPAFAATGSRQWPTRRLVLPDGSSAAELITRKVFGVIASGNLFTGRMIRNLSLSQLLDGTKGDGKDLVRWGVPFEARPRGIRVKFRYDGLGDECTVSACLENRASGVRRYIATAWYRSSGDGEAGAEGVLSVSGPDANGLRTLEAEFLYGRPHQNADPLPADAVYGRADEPVTHVNVVFASSARGDWFEGVEGARLVVQDFEFLY